MKWRINRTIAPLKLGRSSASVGSLAGILDPAIAFRTMHSRAKVWQVKPRPRDRDGNRIGRVQTEKPYTGFRVASYISSHIQLVKLREPWHRRSPTKPHAGHAKWHDCYPRSPFESVYL